MPKKVIALCMIEKLMSLSVCCQFSESGCLGVQPKVGGKFLLKLNNGERPIANKYREGKMQRTLKRELKVLEIVKSEAIKRSTCLPSTHSLLWCWSDVFECPKWHRCVVSWHYFSGAFWW